MKAPTLIAVVAASSFITSPRSIAYTHPVPETMLAAAFDRGGGPEVLSIHRMPVPKPHAGEVLIAVYATGVNVWEAAYRFFFQAEDGIRDFTVTGVQTCALPI